MEIGQIGEIGALVIVITVLEQEQGTEIDLVPTQHHLVMECKITDNKSNFKTPKIDDLIKRTSF